MTEWCASGTPRCRSVCVASPTVDLILSVQQGGRVICPRTSRARRRVGPRSTMSTRREPTARQMRLAVELRRLRDAAGLAAREAAALLGVNPVQISHIEAGLSGVSEERLRRLAAHYACTDTEFVDALVTLATDRTRGWWEEYRGLLPTSFLDLSELDHHASFRRDVAVLYVPGLLQTADYARAVFS